MRIGAHESIAGGLHLAFDRGEADGCEAMQLFTSFNTRWAPRRMDDVEASIFLSRADGLGWPLMSHGSYLVNLASPDPELWQRSLEATLEELCRCETLGLGQLVIHPGAHMGAGPGAGLRRISRALGEIHRRTAGFAVRVLVENTAGQGTVLGHRFEQLARILEQTPEGHRLGVCVDTCHAHAAGYDLSAPGGVERLLEQIARTVGLDRVRAFHLNDCKAEAGSRRDRHAHVGQGTCGLAAFARLVNEPRFAGLPAVVETPPEENGSMSFARNIRTLKGLRR
jgi:deoxyribonuclease-4